jgi:hypothetical protein
MAPILLVSREQAAAYSSGVLYAKVLFGCSVTGHPVYGRRTQGDADFMVRFITDEDRARIRDEILDAPSTGPSHGSQSRSRERPKSSLTSLRCSFCWI